MDSLTGCHMFGMIFAQKSSRKVTIEQAHKIVLSIRNGADGSDELLLPVKSSMAAASPSLSLFRDSSSHLGKVIKHKMKRPLAVGVFLNQTAEEINSIVDQVDLDVVQLHGSEPRELVEQMKRPVIKAISVGKSTTPEEVLQKCEPYAGLADIILLDTKVASDKNSKSGNKAGGTGEAFDWDVAKAVGEHFPVLVAGGLHPGNVKEAITHMSPWGVDVASGCETGGKKDLSKIKAFVENALSMG